MCLTSHVSWLLRALQLVSLGTRSRADGHETDEFSLALSVPAAVQMRHLAMAHALRAALPGDPLWEDPLAATEGAVDVKEALKRTVIGRLEVRAVYRPLRDADRSLAVRLGDSERSA